VSKASSQAAWLAKPQNTTYFCDPVHVTRVQAWRAAHPGYSRNQIASPPPLQDSLVVQVADLIKESSNRGEAVIPVADSALQDLLNAPSPLLAGLIAHLFEVTLQEDIAATTRRLVQLGHDVINRSRDEDHQKSAISPAVAPSAGTVQLG
jgi:hypothetical protein